MAWLDGVTLILAVGHGSVPLAWRPLRTGRLQGMCQEVGLEVKTKQKAETIKDHIC